MSADLCTITCCDAFKLVRGGSIACDGVATAVILCNAHHHVASSLHDQMLYVL